MNECKNSSANVDRESFYPLAEQTYNEAICRKAIGDAQIAEIDDNTVRLNRKDRNAGTRKIHTVSTFEFITCHLRHVLREASNPWRMSSLQFQDSLPL